MAEKKEPRDFRWQPDFKWSRSLSDRMRGMKEGALSKVWKKYREQKLAGNPTSLYLSHVEQEPRELCKLFTIRCHLSQLRRDGS